VRGPVDREVLERFWTRSCHIEMVHLRQSCRPWSNTSGCRQTGRIDGLAPTATAKPTQQRFESGKRGLGSKKQTGGLREGDDRGPRFQLVFPRYMHFPGITFTQCSNIAFTRGWIYLELNP